MSRRHDALYRDQLEDDGRNLIYQGHDARPSPDNPDPQRIDQPLLQENGKPSDNGKFLRAAEEAKAGNPPHVIRVYEKLATNRWVYNGAFGLIDAWEEHDGERLVFKFRLRLLDAEENVPNPKLGVQTRVIPSEIKTAVWKRDGGKCVTCGATDNLHFDHILPFSKGGTSLLAENVQILCARHNLEKRDSIR
jgi:hypothetical protein